jgi:YD repeat-containing protein
MSSATVSGSVTNYVYNALGQLVKRTGGGTTTFLMYDEAGHLLGEYSSAGWIVQETIWMDDTPVATIHNSGSPAALHLSTELKLCVDDALSSDWWGYFALPWQRLS